jgi:predicted amino acid racemase
MMRANLDAVSAFCRSRDLELLPVTKLLHSRADLLERVDHPALTRIADVQAANLARLDKTVTRGRELLRPRFQDAAETSLHATRVFLSDPTLAKRLGELRTALGGPPLGVMLMLEAGDLRDGVPADQAETVVKAVAGFKGISLDGVAVNYGCLAGAVPTAVALEHLAEQTRVLRRRTGVPLPRLSVGGTVLWNQIQTQALPPEVNELRLGEAFFFAWNTSLGVPVQGLSPEVFELELEVLEVWTKNVGSELPGMETAYNAFGENHVQPFTGARRRAVLDGGENFSPWRALLPLVPGVTCVGATHEYTVVDITDSPQSWAAGDTLRFRPGYEAVARAFHSPFLSLEIQTILEGES